MRFLLDCLVSFRTTVLSLLLLLLASTGLANAPGEPDEREKRVDQLTDHAWSLARKSPDSALIYAEEAAHLANQPVVYGKGLINAHTLLGILNKDRGFYETSVNHYLTAMEIAEKQGDSLRVSGCLNNLGVVATKQEDYVRALDYFQRSLAIEEALGKDEVQQSIRLFNIGEAYEQLDSLDEAYAYYYNSLLIEEKLGNKDGVFFARLGIGKVDTRNGNYEKAGQELGQALSLAREIGDAPGICEARIALGELHRMQKRYPQARMEFFLALGKAEEIDYPELKMKAYQGAYRVAREEGEWQRALENNEHYYALREQLNSAEVSNRISELQAQYELKKKEEEIKVLEKLEELNQRERGYDRKLRNYLIFTIVVVLGLTVFNLWRSKSMGRSSR